MSFFQYQEDNQLVDAILYEDSKSPDYYILTEKMLSKEEIKRLRKLLFLTLHDLESICIIYSLKRNLERKEFKKNLGQLFIKETRDLTKLIPKGSKIITIGRALYSIIKNTTTQVITFQEVVWNKTHFYDPILRSWIFPVNHLDSFLFEDSFDRFHFHHQIKAAKKFNGKLTRIPELEVIIEEDPNQFLEDRMNEKIVSWDLETSGFDCVKDDIRCITMSFNGIQGHYLRFKDVDKQLLNKFFENKFQVGANQKFDCRFLHLKGITNALPNFDTLHAGHVLNEMRSNALTTHAWLYTNYGGYDLSLELYKKRFPNLKNYFDIPEFILADYAGKDAIITFLVYKEMLKEFEEDPILLKYFNENIMPTVRMFCELEPQGIHINWNNVQKQKIEFSIRKDNLTKEIFSHISQEQLKNVGKRFEFENHKEMGEFSLSSLKHLGYLFQELGVKKRTYSEKTNQLLTGEEHLKIWEKEGNVVAKLMLEYRGITALLNTFIGDEKEKTAYWKYKNKDDIIYPSISVMLANSHRNKGHNPNLQQVPHHGEDAQRIRSFFNTPSRDYNISEFDYSGLQLRIASVMSKDPNMRKVFTELRGDIHSMTAQAVFTPEISLKEFLDQKQNDLYKDYRFRGKCFSGNTLLHTTKGKISFEDFVPKINPGEFTKFEDEFKIIDEKGVEQNITHTYFDYSNEMYEIELEDGGVIEVTPSHKMIVIRKEKEISIMANQLQKEDLIVKINNKIGN